MLLLTVFTGLVYPAVVTLAAQVAFPNQANGSLILKNGQAVGSSLIGQPFDGPGYFWGRPSATGPYPYNASASAGSNYGPLNPDYLQAVRDRVDQLKKADPGNPQPIPVDLVTASGSGLDPNISVAAALYQVPRVARARGWTEAQVRALVDRNTEGRVFGLIGEPRVNVLALNLALDGK